MIHSFPGEQSKQKVEFTAPTVVEYWPKGQLVQIADDVVVAVFKKVPAGHEVHAEGVL